MLLLARENRLKMCIVPAKNEQDVGIYLFSHYKPCTSALYTMMELVETTREITQGWYVGAYIHPCTTPPISASSDAGDFTTLLFKRSTRFQPRVNGNLRRFSASGLCYPPMTTCPSNTSRVCLRTWSRSFARRAGVIATMLGMKVDECCPCWTYAWICGVHLLSKR